MQGVSSAFKAAVLSDTITPVRSVLIALVDNQASGATITATGDVGDSSFPLTAADNSNQVYGAKWAWADPFAEGAGGRYLADGTLFPYAAPNEGGWEGGTLSDGSGNISGGGSYLNYLYGSAVTMQVFQWWADTFQGYPVNFVISYATDTTTVAAGLDLAHIVASVTGYASPSYMFTNPTPIAGIRQLRIRITKINYSTQCAKLIEFEGSYTVDVSAGIDQFQVLQERFPDNISLVIGNASAGTLSVSQDNTSTNWSPHNGSSPYSAFLRTNRRIYVKAGVKYADGSVEYAALGTYYSMQWKAPGGSAVASLQAQDRMKKLRDTLYRKCPLQIGKTVSQCIQQACLDAGLSISNFAITTSSTVVPYAWATPLQTFFDYIKSLAAIDGGNVFFDENDVLRFQDVNWLHNNSTVSQLTLTDAQGSIQYDDEWNEGEVRNRIVVSVNALQLQSSAVVWSLQETLSVPANSTLTLLITLPNPCTGVIAPVITVGGADVTVQSWTAYAMSLVVVLANANVSAAETVTGLTITAQALISNGTNQVVAETSAVTSGAETPRELSVSNTFIQSSAMASVLATNLLNLYSNPPAKLKMKAVGLPHLELGDRITVNSAMCGINSDFWLIRHTFLDTGGWESDLELYAVV